jgi:hypothetical protein
MIGSKCQELPLFSLSA